MMIVWKNVLLPGQCVYVCVGAPTSIASWMFLSQVGACIVNKENKIVGIGYNGMPNGCSDDILPWARTAEDRLDTKYPYGEHSCCGEEGCGLLKKQKL